MNGTSMHWQSIQIIGVKRLPVNLLDEAEVVAAKQGYHILSLNVDQENPRAQRLYEHKGYQTEKTMTIGDRTYDHMIKRI